jgi:hypothetical protein
VGVAVAAGFEGLGVEAFEVGEGVSHAGFFEEGFAWVESSGTKFKNIVSGI